MSECFGVKIEAEGLNEGRLEKIRDALCAEWDIEEARDVMRRRHYSIHTERTCCDWIKRYIQHFNMKSVTVRSG